MSFTKQKAKLLSILKSIAFRSSKRSRPFFVLALVLIFFLLPLATQHTLAQSAPTIGTTMPSAVKGGVSLLAEVSAFFITPVLQVITYFCALLVDLAAHFLSFMLQPNLYNFTTERIVVEGWIMVRDICNLFFLLILLFIAFCTILQIEKYHLKKTLLTLVIMALLINFSKPIAIFIFDGAQLLMNYFLGANQNYGTTITNLSGIADIVYRDLPGFLQAAKTIDGFSSAAVQYLFAIIFMFMYAMALLVIGIYLVIRIVALWLIVIVSPLAFLAMAVPDFKKMSSEWWDALFKYSYVGPAMAFFLWLSTRLANSFFVATAKKSNDAMILGGSSVLSMGSFISFATVIVFLYASIIIAQKFGIQFASAITSRANKALSFFPQKGWQGAKWGAKKGVSWFNREKLAKWGVSPTVWRDAWSKRTKEREEDVFGDAEARASDKLSRVFKAGRKPKDFYKRRREAEKDAKYKKEQDTMGTSAEIVLEGMKKLYEQDDMDPGERLSRARAFLSTLTASRDFNEAVKQSWLKDLGMNKAMDAGKAPQDMRTILEHFGMTDKEDKDYYTRRYGETAFANRDWHLWNAEEEDADKRNRNLYGKLGVIDKQIFQIGVHSEAVYQRKDDGTVTGLSGTWLPFVRRLNETGGEYFVRMRTQFLSDTFKEKGVEAMKAEYDKLMSEGNTKDANEIRTFVRLMADKSAKDEAIRKQNFDRLEAAGWNITRPTGI